MANLKEIRNRIASVSSTMQITSAMKMVSAAKLKKATDAITETAKWVQNGCKDQFESIRIVWVQYKCKPVLYSSN